MQFRFKVSYMGEIDYTVYGDGPAYEIRHKRSTCDYERSIYNGTAEEYERNVAASVGILYRGHREGQRIKPEVVEAFNAMKAEEYRQAVEKYPDMEIPREFYTPAVGGYYDLDASPCVWVRYDQQQEQAA